MACDCINRIERELTERMADEYPGWEIVESVEFQNKYLAFDSCGVVPFIGQPTLGRVRKGKVVRKYTVQIKPEYCPFCGKKRTQEGGER